MAMHYGQNSETSNSSSQLMQLADRPISNYQLQLTIT